MAWRMTAWGQGIAAVALCVLTSQAAGQETTPGGTREQPPTTEPSPVLPIYSPPISAYPLELLSLLVPQRGPVTLTPSIAISEEYNDNIFLDNRNRESDFITFFSPAITLIINRPSLQLSAGYTSSSELYAREESLSGAFETQNFLATALYRATPGLTLFASDSFALDRKTNLVGGFSSGQQESWINTFTPGLTWGMTPRNSLSLSASYSVLRFEGSGSGRDSDTYGFQSVVGHRFTPRLTGSINYSFTYLEPERGESSTTHTPMLGFGYQFTPTLTGNVSGGPAITEIGGETFVSPSGEASLSLALRFGSASVRYSRGVSVAGGFGGTTDTQTVSASLTLTTLQRGLIVAFSPGYSTSESVNSPQAGQVDVRAFTLSLGAAYQLARYVTMFGGYMFLHQRTGGSSADQVDVDQNRVRFGLQFGYPFNFD